MLFFALATLIGAYWRFAPGPSEEWKTAGTLIEKKIPRLVLFHPAWHADVLDRMPQLPILLLDGPQHLDLAGFGEVLFASEDAQPEALINNLYTLDEWRDFNSKAVAVLRVAAHSLSVDFPRVQAMVEDPPGMAMCNGTESSRKCERQGVLVERRTVMIGGVRSRCLWVEGKSGGEVVLQLPLPDLQEQKVAVLYLANKDGGAGDATVILRIDDADVATLKSGAPGWQQEKLALRTGSKRLEVAVKSKQGACVDVELAP